MRNLIRVDNDHRRETELLLEIAHHLQGLGLDDDIEGGGGLFGYDEVGVARESMAIMALCFILPLSSWG